MYLTLQTSVKLFGVIIIKIKTVYYITYNTINASILITVLSESLNREAIFRVNICKPNGVNT